VRPQKKASQVHIHKRHRSLCWLTDGDTLGLTDGIKVGFTDGLREGTTVGLLDSIDMILRIRLLLTSPIMAYDPSAETYTPVGKLNFEFVPTPFVAPPVVVPARVVTELVEMITRRMR
jgi:hypothetical protein